MVLLFVLNQLIITRSKQIHLAVQTAVLNSAVNEKVSICRMYTRLTMPLQVSTKVLEDSDSFYSGYLLGKQNQYALLKTLWRHLYLLIKYFKAKKGPINREQS